LYPKRAVGRTTVRNRSISLLDNRQFISSLLFGVQGYPQITQISADYSRYFWLIHQILKTVKKAVKAGTVVNLCVSTEL
jgi:hypothetical protein